MQWIDVKTNSPPINLPVLVTDGEECGVDRRIFEYKTEDGRLLLPSDPRRLEMTPEKVWAKYTNITHWMWLPPMPNA